MFFYPDETTLLVDGTINSEDRTLTLGNAQVRLTYNAWETLGRSLSLRVVRVQEEEGSELELDTRWWTFEAAGARGNYQVTTLFFDGAGLSERIRCGDASKADRKLYQLIVNQRKVELTVEDASHDEETVQQLRQLASQCNSGAGDRRRAMCLVVSLDYKPISACA